MSPPELSRRLQDYLGRGTGSGQLDPSAPHSPAREQNWFVYDQALVVFLYAPQALYAVNWHVAFDGYAATFEPAETEASR